MCEFVCSLCFRLLLLCQIFLGCPFAEKFWISIQLDIRAGEFDALVRKRRLLSWTSLVDPARFVFLASRTFTFPSNPRYFLDILKHWYKLCTMSLLLSTLTHLYERGSYFESREFLSPKYEITCYQISGC